MGFDSQCNFAPPIMMLGFLLCPRMWGIFSFSFFLFLVSFNILLLMIVLQQIVILEFLQEKMSAHNSIIPVCHLKIMGFSL